MVYSDDEPIVKQNATDESDIELGAYAEARISNNQEAPLKKSEFKLFVELKGHLSEGRMPLDLVTVLDISGSMGGNGGTRLTKMKLAMKFLIQKLGPTDRLSIVTYNSEAERLCPLRQITEISRREIAEQVNELKAEYRTNTEAGLRLGLDILKDRTYTKRRFAAIMLMSDGAEDRTSHSANVPAGNVPVYTYGFGEDCNPEALNEVAKKSNGGMYSPIKESDDLTVSFALSLAGLLNVAIENLTLTIKPVTGSEITRVSAGKYEQTKNTEGTTVTFGSLYDEEIRKVLVTLTLPEVDKSLTKRTGINVDMVYKYSVGGKHQTEEMNTNVTRVATANTKENAEVVAEEDRIRTASAIKEARILADAKKLEEAREKLTNAKLSLSEVDGILTAQLNKLHEFMADQATYNKQGRAFALALEASHESHRGGTLADVDMFNTRVMNLYKEQAESFSKDPNTPVPHVPQIISKPDPKSTALEMIDQIIEFLKKTAALMKDNPLAD